MGESLPKKEYVPIRRVLKNVGHTATQAAEATGNGEASRSFRPTSGKTEKVSRDIFGRIGYVHLWIKSVRDPEPGSVTLSMSTDDVRWIFCHLSGVQWWQSEGDHIAWKALPADPETGRTQEPIGRTYFELPDYAVVARLVADEKVTTAEEDPLPDDVKTYLLSLAPPKQSAV